MNGRYLRELAVPDLTARLEALTGRTGLEGAAAITQQKISTLDEFWPLARSFFDGPAEDPEARDRFVGTDQGQAALEAARAALAELAAPSTGPGSRRSRSSSRSGSHSRAARSRPASSRRSHSWGARNRWPAWTPPS